MNHHNPNRQWTGVGRRYRAWQADLALRHCWFRVLLHVQGMVRCPRNSPWHLRHISHEFYRRKPRA